MKPSNDINVCILYNRPTESSRGETADYISEAAVEEEVHAVRGALDRLGYNCRSLAAGDDVGAIIEDLKSNTPDVVVNLCEDFAGDSHLEMDVPAILELMRIPYTGSPPLVLGLCQDKALTKSILRSNAIPTPAYRVLDEFAKWRGGIEYPLFVKPVKEDASLGISGKSYVTNRNELSRQVKYINETYRQPALVERYIDGPELNVSIIGHEDPIVLPISEIVFTSSDKPKIVDYPAKWVKDSEEYKNTIPVCPAKLEPALKNRVEKVARITYKTLHCRDYARVDVRVRGDTPYILEVNPNPDISIDAGFPRSLTAAGISYDNFIDRIVSDAYRRRTRTS